MHLRAAAVQYREARLGFPAARIGTHSLRAGATIAMFLAGVPAETIQLIGRWRSQTFMRYVWTANPNNFIIQREDAESQLQKAP